MRSRASHAVKRSYHIQRDALTFSRCDQDVHSSPPLSTSKTVSAEDKPCLKTRSGSVTMLTLTAEPTERAVGAVETKTPKYPTADKTNMQKQFYLPFTSCLHARVNVLSRTMHAHITVFSSFHKGTVCKLWRLLSTLDVRGGTRRRTGPLDHPFLSSNSNGRCGLWFSMRGK